ncbi:hypothetical protein KC926_01040 [Candidatus Kaiserbacteria bacterium]|nr:hypothetical protein [Candidatus Kaiserbacteria bacterium]
MNTQITKPGILSLKLLAYSLLSLLLFLASYAFANAASLSLSPSTGVYSANGTFSVRVLVNTDGKSVNAAEGSLSFNPRELSVVSVNRNNSIFNLWVTEPTFSNSAGTINFSGGLPSGYSGQTGTIMNVTFRAAGAGTARVSFKNGSVLANDGKGTNILTAMNGGTYTIQAQSAAPEPEIIEYVAPANTPAAPVITSTTHGDPKFWSKSKDAVLSWSLPAGVTAVRTLLDSNPTTIPTKVYDSPIKEISLTDLDEGVSYFHIQFKNADGWGKVAHYRLAVDSENPSKIDIKHSENSDLNNPVQVLSVQVTDKTSEVKVFKVKLDASEPFDYVDEKGSSTISLPALDPGYHSVIIEAFDEAGNSIVGTYSFTIEAFSKPAFTEYPSEINEEVIPVIKGLTRAGASVDVILKRVGGDPSVYTVIADETGEFIFIPEGKFFNGVYELSAQATDEFGAQSEVSNVIRIAVQQPGYLKIGSMIISVLSVVVPLVILLFALFIGTWYMFVYFRRFRKKVKIESTEALEILHREFSSLQGMLREQESLMQSSRKTKKLTKAESDMIEILDRALQNSQRAVEKEIEDVTELTKKKD